MSLSEKKLTLKETEKNKPSERTEVFGSEELPTDRRTLDEVVVSELGLLELYKNVKYSSEGTEQKRLFEEIEGHKSGLEKIADFFKEKFGVLVAGPEIAAARERGAGMTAAVAEKSKEYGAKLSEYLEKKIAKVDAEAASIENKTGKNIYRCWKVLGDINLSDTKTDEWKNEHKIGAAVLRFFSLRTALAAGMVGASVVGGAAGGAIEFSRRAMRGVGTAVLAHDFVKMREEQKLSRILEEINKQPETASKEEQQALAKKVIAASALLERKRGAAFSPEEQTRAKERLVALREKIGIDDARMSLELRKSKFKFAATVAGAGAVGFFAGDLWKRIVGTAGAGADMKTYTGINPEHPTHPIGTIFVEQGPTHSEDVRIAELTAQKEPSAAFRPLPTPYPAGMHDVKEYAGINPDYPIFPHTPSDIELHPEAPGAHTYTGINPEYPTYPSIQSIEEAHTLSSEPKGFEKGLAPGIDVHKYARIKSAWLDTVKDVINRAENVPAEEAHAGAETHPVRLTPREYMDIERLASIDPSGKTELGKMVAHAKALVGPKIEEMGIHSETFDGKKTVYQTLQEMYAKDNNAFGGLKPGRVFLQWLEHSDAWSSAKGTDALTSLREHLTMPKGTTLLYANNASEGIEIRENIRSLRKIIAPTSVQPAEHTEVRANIAEHTKVSGDANEETRPRRAAKPRIYHPVEKFERIVPPPPNLPVVEGATMPSGSDLQGTVSQTSEGVQALPETEEPRPSAPKQIPTESAPIEQKATESIFEASASTPATEYQDIPRTSFATESILSEQTPKPNVQEPESPSAPKPEYPHSPASEHAPKEGRVFPESAQPGRFKFSLENFYGHTTPAALDFHYNEKGIPTSFAFEAHFMGTELDEAADKIVQGKTEYISEFVALAKIPFSKIELGEDMMTTKTKMLLVYERVHQQLLDSGKTAEAKVVMRGSVSAVRDIAKMFGREILQWEAVPQFVRSHMAYGKLPTMRDVLHSKYNVDIPARDINELLHDIGRAVSGEEQPNVGKDDS